MNILPWQPIFVGPLCVPFFTSPLWSLQFWRCFYIFGKFVHPRFEQL